MIFLIVISCLAMVLKDAVGTFLVVSEARGNERLSGMLNPFGTIASVIFYSVGATDLVHNYGVKGYLGLIPVLIVDYFDGRFFTAVGRYIETDINKEDAGIGEIFKGVKVVAKKWLGHIFIVHLNKGKKNA